MRVRNNRGNALYCSIFYLGGCSGFFVGGFDISEIHRSGGFRNVLFMRSKDGLSFLCRRIVRFGLGQRFTRQRFEVRYPALRSLLVIALAGVETSAPIISTASAITAASAAAITIVSTAAAGKSLWIKRRAFGAASFVVMGGRRGRNLLAGKLGGAF